MPRRVEGLLLSGETVLLDTERPGTLVGHAIVNCGGVGNARNSTDGEGHAERTGAGSGDAERHAGRSA